MVMIKLKFSEFLNKLESAITEIIENIIQDNLYSWKEDHITENILSKLRNNFKEVKIEYDKKKFINIKTNCFKFNRTLSAEERYGDIAIIVNLSYDDGQTIEGVGLIEAKRIDRNGSDFSAIKLEQLDRIYAHAPHAYLMLYDHERIDHDDNFKNYLKTKAKFFKTPLYASLVPIDLSRHLKKFNRNLYRFSTAFSYQFAYRYIHGLDLEFSEDIIKTAKGYQLEERYPPQYTILVSVKHTKFEESAEFNLPEINSENFSEIGDS